MVKLRATKVSSLIIRIEIRSDSLYNYLYKHRPVGMTQWIIFAVMCHYRLALFKLHCFQDCLLLSQIISERWVYGDSKYSQADGVKKKC